MVESRPSGDLVAVPERYSDELGEIIVTGEQIQQRIAEMGRDITADYQGKAPILVGVLKGAFILMADLARHIQLPVRFDFMAVSSYGSATKTSGVVRILKDLDNEIEGQDVLLIEDIIDSGLTLKYLLRYLQARGPASLEVCALFRKESDRAVPAPVRYQGFRIPSDFVVGYGLDYQERFRNLPFLALLKAGTPPEHR